MAQDEYQHIDSLGPYRRLMLQIGLVLGVHLGYNSI